MATTHNPSVSRYIARIQSAPALDRETELALALRWRDYGDEQARARLVETHMRHAVAIAYKFRRYGLPIEDLIAEGSCGLLYALTKFDPERGNRLVTYAGYWIRAYVLNYILRSWSLVGGGSGALRSKMFFKLRRERARLSSLVGDGEQANRLLAEKFGLTLEELEQMLRRLDTRDVSLDAPAGDETTTRRVDMLPSPEPSQEDVAAEAEVSAQARAAVRSAVAGLDPRERYIVEQRISADGDDELTLAEIARRLGVSRERARQLEARAKKKLRVQIKELERASGRDFLQLEDAA
jgi:RNA polymerase sigma-32 factor